MLLHETKVVPIFKNVSNNIWYEKCQQGAKKIYFQNIIKEREGPILIYLSP